MKFIISLVMMTFTACAPALAAYNVSFDNILSHTAKFNYLKNGSFEQGGTNASFHTIITGKGCGISTDTPSQIDAANGKRSIFCSNTNTVASVAEQSVTPPIKSTGSNFRISLKVATVSAGFEFCALRAGIEYACIPVNDTSGNYKTYYLFPPGGDGVVFGYRLKSTNTNSKAVRFDQAELEIDPLTTVAVQSGWRSYALVATGFGTISNIEAFWKQNGANADILLKFTEGTTTATTAALSLPGGCIIDPSAVPSIRKVGQGSISATAGATLAALASPSGTVLNIGIENNASFNPLSPTNANNLGTGVAFNLFASVPCQGWTPLTAVPAENANTDMIDGGPLQLSTTGGSVTKGVVTQDHLWWKRDNGFVIGRVDYKQTSGGSTGSGAIKVNITNQTGCTIDTAKFTPYTGTVGDSMTNSFGAGFLSVPGSGVGQARGVVYDANNITMMATSSSVTGNYFVGGNTGPSSGSWYPVNGAVIWSLEFSLPCSNWRNAQNAPTLINSVTNASGTISSVEFRLTYGGATKSTACPNGSCTIYDNTGPAGTTITNSGATYTVTVPAGTCTGNLMCTGMFNGANWSHYNPANTPTTYLFTSVNTSSNPQNSYGTLSCGCVK